MAHEVGTTVVGTDPSGEGRRHFYTSGAHRYPEVPEFHDLPQLFDEFIAERHAPAAPMLEAADKVITLGSCFAAHLRSVLTETGFSSDSFIVPEGLNNSFALLDFLSWCVTGEETGRGYRYERGADGQIDDWTPAWEQRAYLDHIKQAGAFVFTLGLAEVWEDTETGRVFWRGVPQYIYDARRHQFRVSSVSENVANLRDCVSLVRTVNPAAPIVFTLSPVPLVATFRPISCMTADAVSKSILRVALDELMRAQMDNVFYWPSFEMVKWVGCHTMAPAYGIDDGVARHVSDQLVVSIIESFVRAFYRQDAYRDFGDRLATRERQNEPASDAIAYEPGTVLDFSDALQTFSYKRDGWGGPEKGGSWTDGPRAALLLRLRRASGDLTLTLDASAFVSHTHPAIEVDVAANGRLLATWHYSTQNPNGIRTATISAATTLERRGAMELSFTVRHPASPLELGMSGDPRLLGLAVKTFSLSPA